MKLYLLPLLFCFMVHGLKFSLPWKDIRSEKLVLTENKEYVFENSKDVLLGVNELDITYRTMDDILQSPMGTVQVIPIVDDDYILKGFAKMEIMHPNEILAVATDEKRIKKMMEEKRNLEIKQMEKVKEKELEEFLKNQAIAEQEKRVEEEKLEKMRKIQQAKQVLRDEEEFMRVQEENLKQEQMELEQMRIESKEEEKRRREGFTEQHDIMKARNDGVQFKYTAKIEFDDRPVGIHWVLGNVQRTEISSLEPHSEASKRHIFKPKDVLIAVNGRNVTNFSPKQTATVIAQTPLPRMLTFLAPMKAFVDENENVNNALTMQCVYPLLIANATFQLDHADWSGMYKSSSHCDLIALSNSDPPDACAAVQRNTKIVHWADRQLTMSYLASRGKCSFPEKAKQIQVVDASSMIVINNKGGIAKFPNTGSQVVKGVTIPVSMIEKSSGELLLSVLEYEEAVCHFTKGHCEYSPGDLGEINLRHDKFKHVLAEHTATPESARVVLWQPTITTEPYMSVKYVKATFGGPLQYEPSRLVISQPQFTACDKDGFAVRGDGAVVLVGRGQCSFAQKAQIVQKCGAIGVIIVNTDDNAIPFMAPPGEEKGLHVWVIGIGKADGERFETSIKSNGLQPTLIKLTPTN